MSKKTPVKKSKRRLKRSVRRSLAAVLMITAIAVAAIPVPENVAAPDGGVSALADEKEDVHANAMKDFGYDPSEQGDASNVDINLGRYAGKTVSELLDAGVFAQEGETGSGDTSGKKVYQSLAIRTIDGTDVLSWQFLYYQERNPSSAGPGGVVIQYNQEYTADKVNLSLMPITAYETVTVENYNKFWSGAAVTVEKIYSYDLYKSGGTTDAQKRDLSFFETYFPEEYRSKTEEFRKYQAAGEPAGQEPEVLTKIPTELADTQKLQYYCDVNMRAYGSGYTLRSVLDNRVQIDGASGGGMIYVAYGGKPAEGYSNDENGYLVQSRSVAMMIAIGDQALKGVSSVENMVISDMIQYIGEEAFADATMLNSINLANVKNVGKRAFSNCVRLETVTFAQGLDTVGAHCFSGCTALKQIELPVSVKKIGYGAFAKCSSLQKLNLDNISVACVIDDYAFFDCYSLNEIKMENANITDIGKGAFAVETGSQQFGITMPRSMQTSIADFMFAGRIGLQYVVFPQWRAGNNGGNIKVSNTAFHDCTNLEYVEFPAPETQPSACGYVTYDSDMLFADVINLSFYVKGPYRNANGGAASPRECTWDAVTAVDGMSIPYLYKLNGKDYYEVAYYEYDDKGNKIGGYLLCIDQDGVLTSCTTMEGYKPGTKLEIPNMVGNTKVQGIATDCFANFQDGKEKVQVLRIKDDSISVINDSTFENWPELREVYIGNSVTKVGNNAFKGCSNLVDVTFGSPANGNHAGFTIGTDAFKTESQQLTFHGDIVKGYAPFEWAVAPDNIIQTANGIRVCYRSLSPSYLTVMYNPITKYVTLLDYPKYSQVESILEETHRTNGDIPDGQTYVQWRGAALYAPYNITDDPTYDSYRTAFADAWAAAATDEEREAIYNDKALYGPWVKDVANWEDWKTPGSSGGSGDSAFNTLSDFLFEPIVVYAAEQPLAYYSKFKYDVIENVTSNDPYRAPTQEELDLVNATKNIVIPEGVDSIDVYGFRYNLDAEGKPADSQLGSNSGNYSTYFQGKLWSTITNNMYTSDKGENVVPGLFSGTFKDYPGGSTEYEKDERGNDLIESVTMNSVKYLPDYAFDNCERLGMVVLGPDCADIGTAPFRGCSRLQTVGNNDYYTTDNGIVYSKNKDGSLTIEECLSARGSLVGQAYIDATVDPNIAKVSEIKAGAFEDCINISTIDLSQTAGLTSIPEDCFKNCRSLDIATGTSRGLSSVELPESVNSIKSEAFAGDTPIKVTIPGREVFIASDAFIHNDVGVIIRTYPGTSAHEYATYYKMGLDDTLGVKCLVTFLDYDGTELKSGYIESDSYAEAPEFPKRDKWIYTGWRAANGADIKDRIKEDTIFVAQGYSTDTMVDGKYKVEFFDTIDFKLLSTQYVESGQNAVEPRVPEHAGYSFVSWSDTFTNITSNKTIFTIFNVTGSSGTSGGTTNTSGGTTTNPSGGTTNTSNGTTNTSRGTTSTSSGTTSSSTSSSSTSATSTSGQNAGMYSVTVVNGSGSGTYPAGSTVLIMANEPAEGKQFSKWVLNSQGVTLANVSTTLTTFVMPSSNVVVTAEFIDKAAAPTTGTVSTRPAGTTGSSNSGNGSNGGTRVDITKPGINNKDLATANVNGSTDNFIVKISETPEATQAVMNALTNKYGSLDNLLYYAMDISLYDSTGTTKITDTTGLTVDITIPLPDALITYGGNNMMGAVVSGQMEDLAERFTTINGVPCISFTATHFSPYTIYVNTQNLSEGLLDTTPKTGDPIHPKWFLSLGLACLSVILFMKKDKKAVVRRTA